MRLPLITIGVLAACSFACSKPNHEGNSGSVDYHSRQTTITEQVNPSVHSLEFRKSANHPAGKAQLVRIQAEPSASKPLLSPDPPSPPSESATAITSSQLVYEFQKDSRYFPKYMLQFAEPVFFWNDFTDYVASNWGDNSNGRIKVAGGYLQLETGKQIWLLYRLGYGTAEFRWASWGALPGADQDKIMGFGDPAESEFVGFRLDGVTGQLVAETRHFGEIERQIIPWTDEYMQPARYFIQWNRGHADFLIITPTHHTKVAEISGRSIPDIRLEISVWNRLGTGDMRMRIVKYDKTP